MLLRSSDWQVHMSWINRSRETCSRLLNMLGLVDNLMELGRCRKKDSERSLELWGRGMARPGLHAYPGLLFGAGSSSVWAPHLPLSFPATEKLCLYPEL